jgi:hypothetical protein
MRPNLTDFAIHNQFQQGIKQFQQYDPHLKRISKLPFSYLSPLAEEASLKKPGIYLITGGRQVGKTTFLKQYILKLVKQEATSPENILFLAGELIDSYHGLQGVIEGFHNPDELQYLFIDEINYIPDWDKAIKYLADTGFFDNTVVILTGSDSLILRTAMKRFAGRRGKEGKVDFGFPPISFGEFVSLKRPKLSSFCSEIKSTPLTKQLNVYSNHHEELLNLLKQYLIHGGYLPAIADYWQEKTIAAGTLRTYIDWIVGDMLKFNKSEQRVFEILKGILATYSTQISWHSLLKRLSIEHHKTVSDYCHLLQNIHAIHILEALDENKLIASPKKNKKIYFQDPFIFHASNGFIDGDLSFEKITKTLQSPDNCAKLIETVVVDHCKRVAPTFYIKGPKGEVDVAMVKNNCFTPIEIKWTGQLREGELKQIRSYKSGIILWNKPEQETRGMNLIIPLPRFLLSIS